MITRRRALIADGLSDHGWPSLLAVIDDSGRQRMFKLTPGVDFVKPFWPKFTDEMQMVQFKFVIMTVSGFKIP
jgi:hypothetical protein